MAFLNNLLYFRDTYIQAEDQDEVLESEDSMKDEEASKKQAYKELKMQVCKIFFDLREKTYQNTKIIKYV